MAKTSGSFDLAHTLSSGEGQYGTASEPLHGYQEQLLQFLPKGFQAVFAHISDNSTYPLLKASLPPSQTKIHIWPWQQTGHELIYHYPTQVLLPAEK